MQYVGVQFRSSPGKMYAYEWDGEAHLETGQRVVVPANFLNPIPSFADVVHVYSSREQCGYKGQLARIMGVVDEEE